MSKVQHLHTYKRVNTAGGFWWVCTDPGCRSRDKKEFLLGKFARCPCGATYTLTNESFRRKNPTCLSCVKDKVLKVAMEKALDLSHNTTDLLNDLFGKKD